MLKFLVSSYVKISLKLTNPTESNIVVRMSVDKKGNYVPTYVNISPNKGPKIQQWVMEMGTGALKIINQVGSGACSS